MGFMDRLYSLTRKANEVPMDNSLKSMIIYYGYIILVLWICVCAGAVLIYTGITEGGGTSIGFIIGGIVVMLFGIFVAYICFVKEGGARCPECGARWSIIYTNIETISEKVIAKSDKNGIKHYRVGKEKVAWKCESCKHEGIGEREYKKEV